eukprot:14728828-Heterocapsa_arctica.AAC.1
MSGLSGGVSSRRKVGWGIVMSGDSTTGGEKAPLLVSSPAGGVRVTVGGSGSSSFGLYGASAVSCGASYPVAVVRS